MIPDEIIVGEATLKVSTPEDPIWQKDKFDILILLFGTRRTMAQFTCGWKNEIVTVIDAII